MDIVLPICFLNNLPLHTSIIDKKIEVASCSVLELFAGAHNPVQNTTIQGLLSIPEYQRPYVWSKKQLQKLITDVKEYHENIVDDKPMLYLGSIILHKQNGKLNIIDGQQRLTTLLLWYSLQNHDFNLPIEFQSPISIQQIKYNLQFLSEAQQLKNFPELDLNQINITLVVTTNEDDAYTFFETQNTGGVRLSGADIIKSHHLRAITSTALVNEYAFNWEKLTHLEYIIDLVTKTRYWNVLNFKNYPSFREPVKLKEAIVEEFTEKTSKAIADISFRQVVLTANDNNQQIQFSSNTKNIRQPLNDGINTISYFSELVIIYQVLFVNNEDHRVPDTFYEFRNKLINGHNGTLFLKELFELVTLAYVSKFGYNNVYEFSLWAFRFVYSKRVTNERTVREDSIFNFVKEKKLVDIVISGFTHEEVIILLKKFDYPFNDKNIGNTNVKGRYIKNLANYFSPEFTNPEKLTKDFDKKLKKSIYDKL